jgi:hypothetical protein
MTLPLLRDLLAGVPAFVPQGVELPSDPTPNPLAVVDATLEFIRYTEACRRTAYRLHDLPAQPLNGIALMEYGLRQI